MHKKYVVAKENDFYFQILKDALVKPSAVVNDNANNENTQIVESNKITVSATTNTALVTNQLSTIKLNSSHKHETNSFNSFFSLFLKLNPISFAQSIGNNHKKSLVLNESLKTATKTETNNGCGITKQDVYRRPFISLRTWFNLFANNNICEFKFNCNYSMIGSGSSIKNGLMQFIFILLSILFFCPKVLICFLKKIVRINRNKNDLDIEEDYSELIEMNASATNTPNNDNNIKKLLKISGTDSESQLNFNDKQLKNFICMFCGKMQNNEIDLPLTLSDELSFNTEQEKGN